MKKPTTRQKKTDEPKFNPTKWMAEHKEFVEFWKEHRNSGHCYVKGGYTHWGILPWQAYESEQYRAEFIGWSPNPLVNDQILGWRKEQEETERLSALLGTTHYAEHNRKIYETIKEEYGSFNALRRAWEEDGTLPRTPGDWTGDSMKAKIDEAYAPEPGQSEEETEALRRRSE
jgi:hypothetical protein